MGKIYHYDDDHKRQLPGWEADTAQPGRKNVANVPGNKAACMELSALLRKKYRYKVD
jgi:hypothetical protein